MKKLYASIIFLFLFFTTIAQTISITGGGITGTAVLNKQSTLINGKPYYTGTGTVLNNPGVSIAIYWLTPDNKWVLTYSGQPYFSNSTDSPLPPGTDYKTWTLVPGNPSVGSTPPTITGDVTLPVTLIKFTATRENNEIKLNWQTSSETNNKGFIIQRSTDKNKWVDLGFIKGAGTTSIAQHYQFTDILARNANILYYRIKQINYDLVPNYSIIVSINPSYTQQYQVLNNPSNGLFTILAPKDVSSHSLLIIYNTLGKKINTQKIIAGKNTIDITNASAGIYFIKIIDTSNIFTTKIIKK